jgi:hypothetical protein
MTHPLPAAPPQPPTAGAEHILAASLFDMPDLCEPMLRLGGWVLLFVAVALLAAHGLSRLLRGRPPPRDREPDRKP